MWGWNIAQLSFWQPVIDSVIIALVALVANVVAKKVATGALARGAQVSNGQAHRYKTLQSLTTSAIGYTISFIALVAILDKFGVATSAIIASVGILGLAISFGAQGLVSDIVTGFFVLLENQVNVDEYVTVAGVSGIVEEVGLRLLKVRDFNGDLHFVPNRNISTLTNHSRGNRRALVDMTIPYSYDTDEAIRVLQAACDDLKQRTPDIVEGPDVVGVESAEADKTVLRIIARTKNMAQWDVERELRKQLQAAIKELQQSLPEDGEAT